MTNDVRRVAIAAFLDGVVRDWTGNKACDCHAEFTCCRCSFTAALERFADALTPTPAPSGWQQRIAAMDPWIVTREDEEACRFCGLLRTPSSTHRFDCLWQNAKDALPPSSSEQDPIAAAVNAQLDPLKAELVDIGHKLAKETR